MRERERGIDSEFPRFNISTVLSEFLIKISAKYNLKIL